MKLRVVVEGTWTFYTPCDDDGNSELYSFLGNVGSKYRADRDGLVAKLKAAACDNSGPRLFNQKICHYVDDDNRIFQIRHRSFRLLMFYALKSDKVIICASPFIKRSDKTPPEELKKARDIQEQYLQAAQNSLVKIWTDEED